MPRQAVTAAASAFDRVRDAFLIAVALAFGAVTLSYPFGRDQSLFAYVGREWFLRGRMPYRDVIEHKPPLIYFVHGVLATLFGTRMWPSRLLEIGVVVLVATLATLAAAKRGERPRAGTFAATLVLLMTFHFGWLTFWDTGNTEIWIVLFVVGAFAALRSIEDPARAAYACGMAIGFAFVAKPPAAWFFPVIFLVAAGRYQGWRTRFVALARMGAAAAVLPAIVAAYFGAKGDLWFLFDVVVRASGHVATRERTVDTLGDVLRATWTTLSWYGPYAALLPALAVGVGWAFASGRRALALRYGLIVLLVIAGYGAMAMQLRFFLYHYGVLAVAAALAFALVAEDLQERARPRLRRWVPALLAAMALLFLVVGGRGPRIFAQRAAAAIAFARGTMTGAELDASFNIPGYFANSDSHRVAAWLRAHSEPTDNIVVRGYEPQIYALADRFFDGRFFWTTFLTHPARAYRREAWLAQDLHDLVDHPPRYAVAFEEGPGVIDTARWFESHGYAREVSYGPFVILAHAGRQDLPGECASALGDETVTVRDGFYDVYFEGTETPLRWSGERGTIVLRRASGRPTWLRVEGRTAFAEGQAPASVEFLIDGKVVAMRAAGPGHVSVVTPIPAGSSDAVVVQISARPPLLGGADPRPRGFLLSRVCWE